MKILIISLLCLCLVLEAKSQFFGRFFGAKQNPNSCNGKKRTWSACSGSPKSRHTIDSCPRRNEVCSDGTMLGELFTSSYLAPDAGSSGTSTSNSLGKGFSSRIFNSQILGVGTITPTFVNRTNSNTCTVQAITNGAGNVIAGKCASSTTRGRKKRQAVNNGPRDLLIMLDESGSVGRNRFLKARRLAIAIVRLLCEGLAVGRHTTHVGIITFNRRFSLDIELNDFYDVNSLVGYIENNIRYIDDSNTRRTCLIQALDNAFDEGFETRNGGRKRNPAITQEIILISDGCENCLSSGREQAIIDRTRKFMRAGVYMYVIGINLNNNCKNTLSLLAQGGKCFHFFFIDNWDLDIDNFIEELENPPQCLNIIEHPSGQCLSTA